MPKSAFVPDPELGEVACKGCGLPAPKAIRYCNLCLDYFGPEWDREAEAAGRLPHEDEEES